MPANVSSTVLPLLLSPDSIRSCMVAHRSQQCSYSYSNPKQKERRLLAEKGRLLVQADRRDSKEERKEERV